MNPALDLSGGLSPKPEPIHTFVTLSDEARQLLAAIGAEAARLRSLERLPTDASVQIARARIPNLRALLERLEDELDADEGLRPIGQVSPITEFTSPSMTDAPVRDGSRAAPAGEVNTTEPQR